MKKKRLRKKFDRNDFELTLLALPTMIWFVLLSYLPMFGLLIPFKKLTLTGKGFIHSFLQSEWSGLKNFEFLFQNNDAFVIMRNTILYNLVFIALGIIIPVILAMMLKELLNPLWGKVTQTIMFIPYFLSWVVVGYFVFAFLSTSKGFLNNVLQTFGQSPVQWYLEEKYWPYILIILNVWKSMGYGMVVYLAAIAGINNSLYESAVIDGASKWQQAKYITLPSLKTIISIMVVLKAGSIFRADFGLFYNVPRESGALFDVTNVIDTFVYRALMNMGNIGMSAATAFLQSIVGFILVLIVNGIIRKIDRESALF